MTRPKTEKVDVEAILTEREQKAITVRCPSSFDVTELEVSGDLVILRGYTNAFGSVRDATRVFKRVR